MKEETANTLVSLLARSNELLHDIWFKVAAVEDVLRENPQMYSRFEERLGAMRAAMSSEAELRHSTMQELRTALIRDEG